MARRRPENIWPTLAEALDRAKRAFPDDNDGMEQSLVLAFQNGEIATQARFPDRAKTFNITGVVLDMVYPIEPHYWRCAKPDAIEWKENRVTFLVPTMFDNRLVQDVGVDVQVALPQLLRWIGRADDGAKAPRKRPPASVRPSEGPVTYGVRLRRAEASRYLLDVWGIERAVNTLAKLATIGGGPGFETANRVPLYSRDELDRWAKSILSPMKSSTSDKGE